MKCQALVISCLDFRFQNKLQQWAKKAGLEGNYDLLTVAGGIKDLVAGERAEQEFLLKQVKLSVELHQVKEIYLWAHQDCGAYGGEQAFTDQATEEDKHQQDLEAAQQLLWQKFPHLTIKVGHFRLGEEIA